MDDPASTPTTTPGELSFKGSRCGRCHELMHRFRSVETEEESGHVLMRRLYVKDECFGCGTLLICIIPVL